MVSQYYCEQTLWDTSSTYWTHSKCVESIGREDLKEEIEADRSSGGGVGIAINARSVPLPEDDFGGAAKLSMTV